MSAQKELQMTPCLSWPVNDFSFPVAAGAAPLDLQP